MYQIIINNNKSIWNNKEKIINNENILREASNGFGKIKDKVTLVNLDLIKKANINHFENNLPFKKEDKFNLRNEKSDDYAFNNNAEFEEYKLENKNKNQSNLNSFHNDDNNKVLSASCNYSDNRYPKINNSNYNNPQDFELTFKNGKNYTADTSNYHLFKFNNKKESATKNNEVRMSHGNDVLEELEFYKNEKLKFEKRNHEVEKILTDKENAILDLNDLMKKNNQEFLKLNSKHNGLLLYASDLQKKLENLEIELLEKNQQISKFQYSDWGEIIKIRDNKINILQNDIFYYKNELNKIKSVIGNEKAIDNDIPRRIDNLIDSYITENKKYKRMVIRSQINLFLNII